LLLIKFERLFRLPRKVKNFYLPAQSYFQRFSLLRKLQSTPAANVDRGYIVKTGDLAPADFYLQLTDRTKTSLKD
jgi:hypothetical protein